MNNFLTCIIPFYNEGARILYTLAQLHKVKGIDSFICIDDGSTDNGAKKIKIQFPKVKIITLESNMGKTYAVKKGLDQVDSPYILLFDADLRNITPQEIGNAIHAIKMHKEIDMVILRRVVESKILTFLRHDVIMSGQRIVKTEDLQQLLNDNLIKGYALEAAMNAYMMQHNKKAAWMPITTKNPSQIAKWGFGRYIFRMDGLKGYFSAVGFGGYLKQIFTFCREEL